MDPSFGSNNPDGDNAYPGPYQTPNSPFSNTSFGFENFENTFGNGNITPNTYQHFNPQSWLQNPAQSPAPPRPVSASNGIQYGSPYQSSQGFKYMVPQSFQSPNMSNGQLTTDNYEPIDPALTYNPDLLTPTSSLNMPGASNFNASGRPPQTISPLALENRPPPYKNPYPQGTSVNGLPPQQATNRRFAGQPQSNQSQGLYHHLTYPQVSYPQLSRSPINQSPTVHSPMMQPMASQPSGNSVMEAVVIRQAPGPPPKTAADLPKAPASTKSGKFRVVDTKSLEEATNSKAVTPFLTVSDEVYRLEAVKATIPKYVERRSRNELEQLFKEGKIPSLPGRKKKEKVPKVKVPKKVLKPSLSGSIDSPKTMVSLSEPSSESEEESEYESETDDETEREETSPLPATRPEDPVAGIRYDTTKVVWSPRNRTPTAQQIRTALISYSELVKGIRDAWRASTTKLQEAENAEKKEPSLLRNRKSAVNQKRLLMETALKTTLENGHPVIIENLGSNPLTMAVLYTFLADRHTEGDNDGSLTVQTLKTMSRFMTLDQDMLEKTKNNKMLSRLVKKASEEVKSLAQKVLDNAAAATKAKADPNKLKSDNKPSPVPSVASVSEEKRFVGTPVDGTVSGAKSVGVLRRAPDPVAGAKRSRESEIGDVPALKRPVAPSNASSASTDASKPKPVVKKIPAPKLEGKPANAAMAGNGPVKSKANMVTTKPAAPNLFASLSSASKKPGTSNAALAAAAKQKSGSVKPTVPARETRAASPPSHTSTFSLSATLASLSEPKKPKMIVEVKDQPPETEEQRSKRLRKEARRHLRVSFKPDDSLSEVRYFTHDPDEEISSGDISHDAGDIRSEGQALKRHLDHEMDEDERGEGEQLYDWDAPTEIDFSVIDEAERKKSFSKRGGPNEAKSPHKKAEEERQSGTLMVFFTSLSDIPPTPREPSADDDFEPPEPEIPFGEPTNEALKRREARIKAARNLQQAPLIPNQSAVTELLARIQGQQQQGFQIPAQQPQQNHQQSFLERTFGSFSQQQQPQAQPTPTAPLDLSRILAGMNQTQSQAVQPTFQTQPQSQNSGQVDVAAILAQFQQQQAMQSNQNFGQQAGMFGQNFGQQNQLQTASYGQALGYGSGSDNDRKRRAGDRDEGPDKRQKGKGGRHPLTGTVVCKYWQEGKCYKGADCSFRHSE